MTMDLLCALLLFVGNVGHLVVLSYKVLKFSELEVGSQPIVALASPSSPSLSALRTYAACSASARKSCWVSLGRSSALRLMAIHSSSFLSAMFSVCSILRQTAEFHPTGYPFCFFTESRIDFYLLAIERECQLNGLLNKCRSTSRYRTNSIVTRSERQTLRSKRPEEQSTTTNAQLSISLLPTH